MLKRGAFADQHFDLEQFHFLRKDEATGATKPMHDMRATRDLTREVVRAGGTSVDRRRCEQLANLLERALQVDPERRLVPSEALSHGFITGRVS